MGANIVLTINSKGGVGKSTLSSNLASYYAWRGARVALCDFDRQMSGARWLQRRDGSRPRIESLTGWEYRGVDDYDWIVIDPPAGVTRKDLMSLIARSDVVVIPVLPSPIDIHATADFVRDVLIYGRVRATKKPIAVVANRARTNTVMYDQLKRFLQSLKLPFVTSLRDSQNYVHASMRGIGIFEMDASLVAQDVEQWRPLLRWIHRATAAGSMPQAGGRRAAAESKVVRPRLRAVN